MLNHLVRQLIPVMSYAEIHYMPVKFFPSFIYRKVPEIIFDVPFMVPSSILPVYLMVKDADRFPIFIHEFEIRDTDNRILHLEQVNKEFNSPVSFMKFEISDFIQPQKDLQFYIYFYATTRNRAYEFINDSYPTKGKIPFRCIMEAGDLPGTNDCLWGDLHLHSYYTEDQIEFGAPIGWFHSAANDLQLDFFSVTDHSYDLNMKFDGKRFMLPDDQKFETYNNEINNIKNPPVILKGIESSLGGSTGQNIHCLILNPARYYPGYGDSGQRYLNNNPTHSLDSTLHSICEEELAIAAHPLKPVKKLHQWILNRNRWTEKDLLHPKITGYQILNGKTDDGFISGKVLWIKHLLQGKKKFIYGGSDSHGNLNLYRQIKIPFVNFDYSREHQFGRMKTGIYRTGNSHSAADILNHLKNGHCFISTGPYGKISIQSNNQLFIPGDEITVLPDTPILINIEVQSTNPFGKLSTVQVIGGYFEEGLEKNIFLKTNINEMLFIYTFKLKNNDFETIPDYVRLEAFTETNELMISNPIWLKK